MIKSVIFVTGSLADGGAEKVMSILASGCAELGADVTLVVLRPKKIVYPVSDKVKIVQFTDDGKLATIKRIRKLHRVLKESAAEVVIPFLPIISLYTMIANIGLRKKVIMSERADPRAQFNNLPWKDKIGNFFMRKCGLFSLADWMVFQTPDNGVLIQMENKNDLVSAMTLIATNSRYVKHISNNAIKIREQLAAPNICQKWLQLL